MTEQQALAYLRGRGFQIQRIDGKADYEVMPHRRRVTPEKLIETAMTLEQADQKRRPKTP